MGGIPETIAVFDTETDGIDVESCRIVSAFIGLMDTTTGQWIERESWLLDIGHEIPPIPASIHGITTERMRAEGTDAAEGVFKIAQRLNIYNRQGIAIAGMNLRYDLTLLDREIRRFYPGMRPLDPKPVVDVFVLDKTLDQWRKGSRKLVDMAPVYGVKVEANAHDAEADCLMAGRIAIKMLGHRWFEGLTLDQLHEKQITKSKEQQDSLRAYFISNGKTEAAATVQSEWPVVEFDEGF